MNNILEIKKNQLKNKLGELVPFDYKAKPGENVFVAYINDIPVRIKSNLTYEQFCKIC